ncbi:MAG: hypothetical protein LKJ87_02645 [Bacteroidales bacterium]|jgi:hypothetical protein|nr:hypothetical protein [Bacteroidales bacterium]
MRKTLLFAAALTMLLASCDKNNDGKKELDAEFALETVGALTYGEPVALTGTITSNTTIDKVVFTGAKKAEDGTFAVVGEAQEGSIDGTTASVEFFADSKDINAIEVVLSTSDAAKKFYFDAPKVTGEPKGDVYFNDSAVLYPDNKVENHENSPEKYPDEFTGAGSDTKSFFSMHGVKVGGKVEHILSLNDLLAVDGKNASFCFLNVLENTAKNITLGSQRGYMYSGMKRTSLGGGTTGRQCDIYKYGDHQIMDENVDINFTMKYVRGSWAGKSYHPELFTAVDNIFVNLKKAETNLEKIKAFYALGEIQRKLDNSTLGVTEEPTSLGGKTYLRKWVGAGNGKSLEEVQRAGDYIIIRSVRQAKGEETPRYYYGLIQVMMFEYDDAQTFVEKDGLRFIDPEKAKDLFMKPVYLDIKTQCEIAE